MLAFSLALALALLVAGQVASWLFGFGRRRPADRASRPAPVAPDFDAAAPEDALPIPFSQPAAASPVAPPRFMPAGDSACDTEPPFKRQAAPARRRVPRGEGDPAASVGKLASAAAQPPRLQFAREGERRREEAAPESGEFASPESAATPAGLRLVFSGTFRVDAPPPAPTIVNKNKDLRR